MTSFLFNLCLILAVYTNWSQLGHDERNTYRSNYVSKSSKSWSISIDSYGPKVSNVGQNPFFMDDRRGTIWLLSQMDWSYGWKKATAIDSEKGTILFSKKIGCTADCGLPVLTERKGDMIFYAGEDNAIETIEAKNGEIGWIFNITAGWNTAITKDDVLIIYTDSITAIKFGAPNEQILWNLDLKNENNFLYDIGYFTTASDKISRDQRVYFSDTNKSPYDLWIVDAESGEIVQKKPYSPPYQGYSNDGIIKTKFTVDSKNSMVYFVDNWSGEGKGPFLLAMEDTSLTYVWNISLNGSHAKQECSPPILARPTMSSQQASLLVTFCSTWVGCGNEKTVYVINAQNGTVLRTQYFSVDEGCEQLTLAGKNEDKVVIQCSGQQPPYITVSPKIVSFDILTGELETLVDDEKSFLYYPIADSGNCIFYCTGDFAQNPVYIKKFCF